MKDIAEIVMRIKFTFLRFYYYH